MTKYSVIIQEIVGTQFALEQRPRSSQQNGLLGNKSGNLERPEKLGLEELLIEKIIDWGNMKA